MTDEEIAKQLCSEYADGYETILHFVQGCGGRIDVARIAVEARITSRVLLKFNAVDHFRRKLGHE